MKYAVLGGSGFLGSYICQKLIENGIEVNVFDHENARYNEFLKSLGANMFYGDFQKQESLIDVIQKVDGVIHLISTTVPGTSNENFIYDIQTNVNATINLLNLLNTHKVKKIIFASSGGTVYGDCENQPIDENAQTNPKNSYGICKLMNEKYIMLFNLLTNINCCILRISNAYGERQPLRNSQGVIPAFINNLLLNNEVNIWGDGENIRDYVHGLDIANAFVSATKYNGSQRIFNIGSGVGTSINQLVDLLSNIHPNNIRITHYPSKNIDVKKNILSIKKAQDELHWKPTISLSDAIQNIYFYRKYKFENGVDFEMDDLIEAEKHYENLVHYK